MTVSASEITIDVAGLSSWQVSMMASAVWQARAIIEGGPDAAERPDGGDLIRARVLLDQIASLIQRTEADHSAQLCFDFGEKG
jgi:hypothetical protein